MQYSVEFLVEQALTSSLELDESRARGLQWGFRTSMMSDNHVRQLDAQFSSEVLHEARRVDLRQRGTRVYATVSRDHGATSSADMLVYESPSGSVCECCHPAAGVERRWPDGDHVPQSCRREP